MKSAFEFYKEQKFYRDNSAEEEEKEAKRQTVVAEAQERENVLSLFSMICQDEEGKISDVTVTVDVKLSPDSPAQRSLILQIILPNNMPIATQFEYDLQELDAGQGIGVKRLSIHRPGRGVICEISSNSENDHAANHPKRSSEELYKLLDVVFESQDQETRDIIRQLS